MSLVADAGRPDHLVRTVRPLDIVTDAGSKVTGLLSSAWQSHQERRSVSSAEFTTEYTESTEYTEGTEFKYTTR